MSGNPVAPGGADVQAAAERIRPFARRTPVLTCRGIDEVVGATLFFKCENFQKGGAFKFRGACNAVFGLDEDAVRAGVATHSSGNHAAALALAAGLRGSGATVVMPRDSSRVKRAAVEAYGARVVDCDPTHASRDATLAAVVEERGCTVVHPYDDPFVIAGQGTAALELIEEVPDLDVLMAPVGGGGLISGSALAARHAAPGLRVVGAEPAGADDTCRSLEAGRVVHDVKPRTVADGLRALVGGITFPIIRDEVDRVVRVSEPGIIEAMRLVWTRMKVVIEPSSAVPLAALLEGSFAAPGARLGIIVSGGNVDLDALPWRED